MTTLKRLNEHIEKNPNDYQAVIALYKKNNDEIVYERRQKIIERIKLYKKMENKNGL